MPDSSSVRAAVAAVPDPEMPMLTLEDLGVLRSVTVSDGAVASRTPWANLDPPMPPVNRVMNTARL